MNKIKWLIGLGVVFRVIQFSWDRSLWCDEASLVMAIARTPFLALLKPFLSGSPGAPFGFQVVEKIMLNQFGLNEYSVRFFPLVAGIISIFLMARLLKHLSTRPSVVAVGVALFILSDNLIYYSAEVRPGTVDVVAVLAVTLLAIERPFYSRNPWRSGWVVGLLGGMMIWFSHASIFCLAGIGATMGLVAIYRRRKAEIRYWAGVCFLWASSFFLNYWVSVRHFKQFGDIHSAFSMNFLPFPPQTIMDWLWLPMSLVRHVAYFSGLRLTPADVQINGLLALPLGQAIQFAMTHLGLLIYIVVVVITYGYALFVGSRIALSQRKIYFLMLLLPFGLGVIASCIGQYPFLGRFFLYTFPLLIWLVSEAVVLVAQRQSIVWRLVLILIFLQPVGSAAYHLFKPRSLEYVKFGFHYICERYRPSDSIVYVGDLGLGEFYSQVYQLPRTIYSNPADLETVIRRSEASRVWIVSNQPVSLSQEPVFKINNVTVYTVDR